MGIEATSKMVLNDLGKKITGALQKLSEAPAIDEDSLKELLKEIGNALMQADVPIGTVMELRKSIKNRIDMEMMAAGYNKKRLVQLAVFEELCEMLNPGKKPFAPKKGKSSVIMFVGLQGAGKTTSCTKYASHYKKQGFKVALVCADTYRAGALDQLKQNAMKAKIPFYGSMTEMDPVAIADDGVRKFKEEKMELIIVDTSGRHKQEDSLFEEMAQIEAVVEPNDIIFVMDSTIGQAAKDQAEAFKDTVKVGSVILTKLDGHAKGGGAISAVAATNSPIVFIGTGEHVDDFESFEAKRFVQRLLGMGDIKGLLDLGKNIDLEKSAPAMMARLQKGEFSLRDMREQFQMVLKMGPLDKMIGMLPGFAGDMIPKGKEKESEARIKGFLIMMDSMTFDELDGIDSGRAKKSNGKMAELKWADQRMERVARGSGYSMQHVFTLLEERKRMAKVMSKMKGMKIGKNGDIKGRNMPAQMSKMLSQLNPAFAKAGGEAQMKQMLQQLQNGGGGMEGLAGMMG